MNLAQEPEPISRQREQREPEPGEIRNAITYLPDVHRLLPQSPDAERALLGSVLLLPSYALPIVLKMGVTPEVFHIPAHATIFDTVLKLENDRKEIDLVTVTQKLTDSGKLEECGGPALIAETFTFVPTAANVAYYAEIILEKAFLRGVIVGCTQLAARAYDEQEAISELRTDAEAMLSVIGDKSAEGKLQRTISQAVGNVMDKVQAGKTEETFGLSTGFPNLDAIARGLRVGNMISIGGETSSGKTSLALNIVHAVCVKRKIPTVVFSLEMDTEEVTEVLVQIGSGVNLDAQIEGRTNAHETESFGAAAKAVALAPLTIHDETDLSIVQARSIARRLKPRLIVIDYAQLMTGGKKRYDRSDLEIAEISRGAKKMAGELGATLILITQLNEDGKTAGSRSIVKDANQHWIVKEEDDKDGADLRTVQVCKNRRGVKDQAFFRFIGPCQKFLPKALT